jgi:hypothetical protein
VQQKALSLLFRQCADGEPRRKAFPLEQVCEQQGSIDSVSCLGRVRAAGPAQGARIRLVLDGVANKEKDGFGIGTERLGLGIGAPLHGIDTDGDSFSPFQELQWVRLFRRRMGIDRRVDRRYVRRGLCCGPAGWVFAACSQEGARCEESDSLDAMQGAASHRCHGKWPFVARGQTLTHGQSTTSIIVGDRSGHTWRICTYGTASGARSRVIELAMPRRITGAVAR